MHSREFDEAVKAERKERRLRTYPVRTCYSLHYCELCRRNITYGEAYHDGGYGRRAHVSCVRSHNKES